MTGKIDDLVAVNVNVSSLVDADTCKTVSHVVDGGTVSDLRIVLVQDGVIRSGDGSAFKLPGGRIVGKSSEDHVKWHSLLENDEVHVLLVPPPTADLSDGLSVTAASDIFDDDKHLASASAGSPSIAPQDRDLGELRLNERLYLIRKSKLGEGINVCDDHGPQFSGHSVIADIDPCTIRVMDIDDAQYEAIVTSSARTAAYLAAGWTMPAINSTEFARSGQGRSYSTSTIWVTGRYLLSSCQLTLPGAHSLKPHPELQAAVDRALAEQDPVRCTQKLDAVWQCYGHVYVDSVEMGGMCHLTSAVTASEQLGADDIPTQMESALHKKFDFQDEPSAPETMFEKRHFKRVGGLGQSEDISHWKSSLTRSVNRSVTRTLRVVPVVDLFDEEIQRKILTQNSRPSFKGDISTIPRETFGETGIMELPSFRESTTAAVTFTQCFNHPPFVSLGINRLDFNHTTMFRFGGKVQSVARDHADLSIVTGNDTPHYGSKLSWLVLPFADPDLQHGTFDRSWIQLHYVPSTSLTSRVTFERPYDATPKVVLWLHHVHMDSSDDRIRIAVYMKDVSREGFALHVDTWDGSQILEVGVSWLAHSVSRAGFASGTYDTQDVHPDTEPREKTSGHVGFGDAQFARRPTSVFTTLHRLDISKATTPRLALSTDNITETGMDWHIDTWWDSTLYAASASFIAF